MARRKTIFATNEIYHTYNRGVEKRPIFLNGRDYLRFIDIANYYRFANCPMKFSYFKKLSHQKRNNVLEKLENESKKLVNILSFCLMPNHFHFLLKQLTDNGISTYMAKVTSGFSHYFNIRHERIGHLFQGNFGAVRIENEEQLIHVSRYIHLNPVTSYLIEISELDNYTYSSYLQYINKNKGFCITEDVLSGFSKVTDYKKFIEDQVDYARQLENIKHLTLEE